jgi:hypothetical protein
MVLTGKSIAIIKEPNYNLLHYTSIAEQFGPSSSLNFGVSLPRCIEELQRRKKQVTSYKAYLKRILHRKQPPLRPALRFASVEAGRTDRN